MYNAKEMLIIYRQVFLGFCHYLVVASSRIWAPVGADCQSSCSLEGFHSIKFSYPRWNHYNSELQSCIILPFLYLLVFLWHLCCSEGFSEQFLKYTTVWQQRHCWVMFGEPTFKITLKTCYHWPGFTLMLPPEWPETSDRLWPTTAPTAAFCSSEAVWASSPRDRVARSQLCLESWVF